MEHFLPGIGTKHRCILEKGQKIVYTSSFSYDPENMIVFSETDEKKEGAMYFVVEPLGEKKSRLTLDLYASSKLMKVMFDLFMKKKMQGRLQRSLQKLETLVQGIVLPVEF